MNCIRIGRGGAYFRGSLKAILRASTVTACLFALTAGYEVMAASSETESRPDSLLDLGGLPAYQTHIATGVRSWLLASEAARRMMLIGKCDALDRTFPARPAPRMVHVFDEATRWLTGEEVPGVPRNELAQAGREVTAQVIRRAYTPRQLEEWNKFRESTQGRRGLAVASVRSALLEQSAWLVDVSTGSYWSWPLARVRLLAEELQLRPALDSAFNEIHPSGAQVLGSISRVPGETSADARFMESVAEAAGSRALVQAFMKHVSKPDAEAFAALQKNDVYSRWTTLSKQLREYQLGKPVPSGFPGLVNKVSFTEFCKEASFQTCDTTDAFAINLERYKARLGEAQNGFFDRTIQQLVKQSPEAGCP